MTPRFLAALLTALVATLAAPTAWAQAPADRIWTGGPILTMNDGAMRAEAVAEKGGRIVAVGTAAEVMKLKGAGTKVIDLAGRATLPGFLDAHGHMFVGGIQALSANLLAPPDGTVTDIASLQKAVRGWMAANAAPAASVSGTIAYRERVALSPAAVIKVQLVDVSRADAPAIVLGEQVFEEGGKQVPFAFEIPYDPAAIEPGHSHAVQARIEVDGQLRFINDQRYAVITRGAPTRVDLVLKSVGGPAPR